MISCNACPHPPHGDQPCPCVAETQVIRDDVGFFAPPSGLVREIITKMCRCGHKKMIVIQSND